MGSPRHTARSSRQCPRHGCAARPGWTGHSLSGGHPSAQQMRAWGPPAGDTGRRAAASSMSCTSSKFRCGEVTPTVQDLCEAARHLGRAPGCVDAGDASSVLTRRTHSTCTMTSQGRLCCTVTPCRSTPPAVLQPRMVAAQAAAEVLTQRPGFRRPASAQTAQPQAHIMHAIRGSKGSRPPSAGGTNLVQGRRLRQAAQ